MMQEAVVRQVVGGEMLWSVFAVEAFKKYANTDIASQNLKMFCDCSLDSLPAD